MLARYSNVRCGNFLVGCEQGFDGFAIESRRRIVLKAGGKVAALSEILIASRALLPVPTLLVGHDNGGEDGEALDGERDVGEVGDGAVPVLEVESVEKFLRLLQRNFLQRLLHRERRTRILGHGVGLDLGFDAVNGKYLDGSFRHCSGNGTRGRGLG